MAESSQHNRVCSVLFIDIVGYSRKTVAEQMVMKRECNTLVADALGEVADWERVILDTGDGAAVTFLGAPENALFVALRARDGAGRLAHTPGREPRPGAPRAGPQRANERRG